MVISELIEELQEIRKVHGDIEVLTISDTYSTGEWVPLEDSGVIFDRFKEGKNIVYIGW